MPDGPGWGGEMPTIAAMLHNLNALLAPALMDRLVLLVNHVLGREPQAMARLQPHAGRILRLELLNWPRLLPQPPTLAFAVTPAGLVEWCQADVVADLRVRLEAGNPAALAFKAMSGGAPALSIDGDVQLAADVDWLLKNLRWEVADDLQRLFGPAVAGELGRLGSALARALRSAGATAASAANRSRKP